MTVESLALCIVAADAEGVEAQWPPGITAEIRFVDPRFSLVDNCYWYSVECCVVRS